ncbi:MAG: PKD domain-containing protein [Thermoproteota archaeon]|nr:PKD domain-containing protein [Thermoproteota archaeon]
MKRASMLLVSSAMTITLAVITISIILFSLTITLTSAQQQQPLTNQQAVAQNRTTQFQNTEDSIRLQIPPGWIIQDVNNTGLASSDEVRRGYGIVAQLCAEKEEQKLGGTAALRNSSNNTNNNNDVDCQRAQEDVIHVIRYPNLDTVIHAANNNNTSNSTNATATPINSTTANNNNNNNNASGSSSSSNITNNTGAVRTPRTTTSAITISPTSTTTDKILSYHLQKLQQVGYHDIKILRSANMRVNLTAAADANQTVSVVPAKFAQISYTTAIEPNKTKTGYFILTYTNATGPNLGTTKGYALFYEGNSSSAADTRRSSNGLAPAQLSEPVKQILGSFELITAPAATTRTEPLTVEITSNETEGRVAPATFEFKAEVTGGTGTYTYNWELDDAGSEESNKQIISHTFDEAGSYTVSLNVTDSGGQRGSDSTEITIEDGSVNNEQQPAAVEGEEDQVEENEEDNDNTAIARNNGDTSDSDSNDVDEIVDDFLDDLFNRLGLR